MNFLGMVAFPQVRRALEARAERQRQIIELAVLLPAPYKSIEAAVNATGLNPRYLYYDLSAGYETPALVRLAEALNMDIKQLAPCGKKPLWT